MGQHATRENSGGLAGAERAGQIKEVINMTTILFSVILLIGMTVSYAIGADRAHTDDAEELAALREENAKLRAMAKRWTVPE
jgi:hypothetical protein